MVHVLKENIQLNGLQNVLVNAVAVGIADGRGFPHSCMGKDGDNEGMNFVTDHVSHKTDLAVDQVSIGEYCPAQTNRANRPDENGYRRRRI